VASTNGKNYAYDDNGNMTARGDDGLFWDLENRLDAMTVGGITTTMSYGGDGTRVKKSVDDGATITTTYYVGNWYEKTSAGMETKYYYHGGRLVSLRRSGYGTDNSLYYLHLDHLGSTMLTTITNTVVAEQRFYPWGQATRYISGTRRGEACLAPTPPASGLAGARGLNH